MYFLLQRLREIKMTFHCKWYIMYLFAATWLPITATFQPKLQNGSTVCAVGQSMGVMQAEVSSNGSCVPMSVRCAFACQQNSPNCTCFNYYSANGSCEFFGGSSFNVTYQQRCTLWVPQEMPPATQRFGCPTGFNYTPETNGCYRIVLQSLQWSDANAKCSSLNPSAYLAVITSEQQNDALTSLLEATCPTSNTNSACSVCQDPSGSLAFYTSAQRVTVGQCDTPIVWKPNATAQLPLKYNDWGPTQPVCPLSSGQTASCTILSSQLSYQWSSCPCSDNACSVCQVDAEIL